MAAEAEQVKAALEKRLAEQQVVAAAQPKSVLIQLVSSANTAASAVQLDEADTRKLIDQQLRQAGWDADSQSIKYNKGARPERGRNLAIAEWPTESGPVDYVLFAGLMPIAVVEAKRKNVDVSGSLQQAKRYSRTFTPSQETILPDESWGEGAAAFRVPFAFSANGRPYLRQLATKSGIWFCDLRRADNLGHVLDGWCTPEGLTTLLKWDEAKAYEDLANAPFNYGFPLRYYQQDAIRAAESAIEAGQREMLLAMATGTGKTKTCIALIYRLLKAKRFRRILFLVDRSALGEQAANAFKDNAGAPLANGGIGVNVLLPIHLAGPLINIVKNAACLFAETGFLMKQCSEFLLRRQHPSGFAVWQFNRDRQIRTTRISAFCPTAINTGSTIVPTFLSVLRQMAQPTAWMMSTRLLRGSMNATTFGRGLRD